MSKYSMVVEIDTERDSPCAIGEFLRGKFWPPQKKHSMNQIYYTYGCYSEFQYGPDVTVLPERPDEYPHWDDEESWNFTWKRAQWTDVICEWYWDGDGCLRFILPGGNSLINTDCKKDYEWEWE